MKKDKLAIASITCNRPALFSKSLTGIAEALNTSDDDLYYIFHQNENQSAESTYGKIAFESALLPSFRCFPDMESLEQASSPAPKFSLIDKAQQQYLAITGRKYGRLPAG